MKNRAQCKTGAYGPQGGGIGVVKGSVRVAADGLAVVAERGRVLTVFLHTTAHFSSRFLRVF
jgi:hypothetical protein